MNVPDIAPTTRERILDAAERLFAQRGYYGVTIRQITHEAGVDVALASYYFGPKVALFSEVVRRRAQEHYSTILGALNIAVEAAGDRPPSVEALIRAFVQPVFDRLSGDDEGWRNYVHLLAQLSNSQQLEEFTQPMNEVIDPYIRRLIEQFRLSLPTASEQSIATSYYMLQAAVINIYSQTGGIDRVSDGLCDSSDLDKILDHLVPFFAAGFHRMASD